MANTLVRLKKQPSNGEDQVVIKIQFNQKQYPFPVPNVKVDPSHFDQNDYGNWLQNSYTNSDGVLRSKNKINKKIKDTKTAIDVALDNLIEAKFQTISVAIIKKAIGQTLEQIKERKSILLDPFYEQDLLTVFKDEFLKDPFAKLDEKNLKALFMHLGNYSKSLSKPLLIKDINSELFKDFTEFLLGYQFKKGSTDDYFTYLTHDSVFKQIKKLRKFVSFLRQKKKQIEKIEYTWPFKGTLNVVNPQALSPLELDQLVFEDFKDKQMNNARNLYPVHYTVGQDQRHSHNGGQNP